MYSVQNIIGYAVIHFSHQFSILKTSREDLKRSLSEQPNLAPAERDLLTHLPDEVFDTAITTSLSSLSFILESLSYMERKFKEGPKGYIELSAKVSGEWPWVGGNDRLQI